MSAFSLRPSFFLAMLAGVSFGSGQGLDAYFSSKADGSDTTTVYEGQENQLYLYVKAAELPPGQHPKATLVTGRSVASAIPDMETVVLTRMNELYYAAAVLVERKAAFMPGDGKLNLEFGDVIIGTYEDPANPEARAVAKSEFGYYPALGSSPELQ